MHWPQPSTALPPACGTPGESVSSRKQVNTRKSVIQCVVLACIVLCFLIGALPRKACGQQSLSGITSGSFVTQQLTGAKQNNEKRGTIAWFVKRAKEQNKTKVFVPPPERTFFEVDGLDDALSTYAVLVVRPIEQKVAVLNEADIITWHKLKVLDLISYPARGGAQCLGQLTPPQEILSLKVDEILVATYGGSLEVDGIQLESRDPEFGEHFIRSNKYLVFLSLDLGQRVGKLSLGPHGVFALNSSDQVVPIVESTSPLVREVKSKFDNSLIRFKERLHTRSK
jgi:hypothetical protein